MRFFFYYWRYQERYLGGISTNRLNATRGILKKTCLIRIPELVMMGWGWGVFLIEVHKQVFVSITEEIEQFLLAFAVCAHWVRFDLFLKDVFGK